jgi:DNA-binding MarR family transcriptional regulator
MEQIEKEAMVDTVLSATRALVAMAIRTLDAGPVRVTVTQQRVLALIEEGDFSVSTLADRLGVDQSNASRHCTQLEKLGLVVRRRASHDGRSVDLRVTSKGTEQVRRVRDARRRAIEAVLDHMPDDLAHASVAAFMAFEQADRELAQGAARRDAG